MKAFLYILLVLFLIPSITIFAQTDDIVTTVLGPEREARLDSLIDDLFQNDKEMQRLLKGKKLINMHYLYYRNSLSTKTIFAGREIGDNQINVGTQLYYLNGAGFYVGLSGAWYNQLDPGYRTTALTGGYSNYLFKMKTLRVRLSYQRYISHIDDPLYEPLYTQSISSGLTLKSKNLGFRVDGSLNFGSYNTGKSLSFDVYGNFVLYNKGSRKQIWFRPEVSLMYGGDYQEFMLDESLIDPYTGIEYTSYYEDVFGLMNVQFKAPLYFSYKNFDLQITYNYNLPQNFVDDVKYPKISSLQFSIGYFFSVGK